QVGVNELGPDVEGGGVEPGVFGHGAQVPAEAVEADREPVPLHGLFELRGKRRKGGRIVNGATPPTRLGNCGQAVQPEQEVAEVGPGLALACAAARLEPGTERGSEYRRP